MVLGVPAVRREAQPCYETQMIWSPGGVGVVAYLDRDGRPRVRHDVDPRDAASLIEALHFLRRAAWSRRYRP